MIIVWEVLNFQVLLILWYKILCETMWKCWHWKTLPWQSQPMKCCNFKLYLTPKRTRNQKMVLQSKESSNTPLSIQCRFWWLPMTLVPKRHTWLYIIQCLKPKLYCWQVAELDLGLSITSLDGKSTLHLKQDTFHNVEDKFKKYFMCKCKKANPKQKELVCLGCTIHSYTHLITWNTWTNQAV